MTFRIDNNHNILQHVEAGDTIEFKNQLDQALSDKVRNALEDLKIDVANKFFGTDTGQ